MEGVGRVSDDIGLRLFLFVNVLRIRAAPAATLSVHFGLAGSHLIVRHLSTLSPHEHFLLFLGGAYAQGVVSLHVGLLSILC